jgi:hypothetical protein
MSRRGKSKEKDIKIGAMRIKTDIPEFTVTIPNILILIGLALMVADIVMFRNLQQSIMFNAIFGNIRFFVLGGVIIIAAVVLDHFIDFKGEGKEKEEKGLRALIPGRQKKRRFF